MATAIIQPSFSAGELSPSLFGRVDLAKWHVGTATMRNFFVNYRGGASSRAGTLFVGCSKQGSSVTPPRLIRFQFSLDQGIVLEFGQLYIRFISDGGYITEATKTITGVTKASPGVVTSNGHGYSNGDQVFLAGIVGMTQLNGNIYTVANVTANTFTLIDLFNVAVNTTNFTTYTSGGTAARLYTVVSPYAAVDLPSLKFTQSADVMSFTHPSYAPYDLTRIASTNWTMTKTSFAAVIAAPTGAAAVTTVTTAPLVQYQFVVTAVDSVTGQESVASNVALIASSNLGISAGSITITWNAVAGAGSYRIYQAPISYTSTVPAGALYGYVGTSLGNRFVDTNIIPDFSTNPPLHLNPFSIGAISSITMTNQGTGYTSDPAIAITTSTGSGAVLQPIVVGGKVQAVLVVDAGQNYVGGDTIAFSGGGGANAAGTIVLGPASGTYPSVVAYFQERRVYANTTNNPDTYFMSQPGAFTNFDSSPIPLDSDAIIGTPWAQQVNGIQALVPVPTGLIALTGLGAWLVSGGGAQAPITPTNQSAQAQAYNGCHDFILPIVVNYDVLYVQSKGSIVRDLSYNLWVNIYTGSDISILSDHLFENHQLIEWALAEEPFKIVWAVRDDGVMLSLTYLKEQEVQGWARHDTLGLFESATVVTESVATLAGSTFVDVLYVVVKRYIQGQWLHFVERMDPRIWESLEQSWCLDAAASLTQPTPSAILTASQSTFPGKIGSISIISGGSGYSNTPIFRVIDPLGSGSGAVLQAVVTAGVITSVIVIAAGSGYTTPQIILNDSTGSGAVFSVNLDNTITFTASAAVFSAGNVGDIIRAGGGRAQVTFYTSTTIVVAQLLSEITQVLPNDPNMTPVPAPAGSWSITTPVTTVSGLSYLEGQVVNVLADGSVVSDLTVTSGSVTLPSAASAIIVGLPFQAQIQSLYTDVPGEATVQGKRKNIYAVTVRVRESRGLKVGSNQIDASTQPFGVAPAWENLIEIKERGNSIFAGTAIPLFTGDERVNIPATWRKPGQIAVQQDNPLPANILAFIPEIVIGDTNG